MALNKDALGTPLTPEWWMRKLAAEMLDVNRLRRFGILEAYRSGCPPMVTATESQRKTYHAFSRVSRSNFARPVIRACGERMAIRAIKTAAVNDDDGDQVAWRYFTGCGLGVAAPDVYDDQLTFSQGVVRVGLDTDGNPVALRRDPRHVVTAKDPMNPMRTIAALELLWDEYSGTDYAILSLPGQEWVAARERTGRPQQIVIPGLTVEDRRRTGMSFFPRLSFDPTTFTMRPLLEDVAEKDRDGLLYSQRHPVQEVCIVEFPNRGGIGEFEEHLDKIDMLNMLSMLLMVTAGVQAYKQRSLQQSENAVDMLPQNNPTTGEPINWDEIFQPGPDALWKLPPGVTLKESGEVNLQGLLSAINDETKRFSSVTATPFSLFSPDGVNQSAEGAQLNRESLVFKVEDRCGIAGLAWAKVISLLFALAPDEDRFAGDLDRADAGAIVLDWKPAERHSLAERSQADSLNKSLSHDMAAQKIWGLTPDEVALNKAQRNSDALLAATALPAGSDGPAAA